MGYTAAQANEFINRIAPIIRKEASKRGYKICSTVIAQAIVEGACGTSGLAKKYYNHFGLKAGSLWIKAGKPVANLKTMEEYIPGKLTQITDGFRVYKDDVEGVAGYYDFISTSRYANLKTAKNYREYAYNLKADGYATSSTYINTLCNTVEKYGLQMYDDKPVGAEFPVLKMGSEGQYVKIMQHLLNNKKILGGNLTEDGKFGTRTLNAVIEFQALNGLAKDGVVGEATWEALNK